jgi:hypothetical protein
MVPLLRAGRTRRRRVRPPGGTLLRRALAVLVVLAVAAGAFVHPVQAGSMPTTSAAMMQPMDGCSGCDGDAAGEPGQAACVWACFLPAVLMPAATVRALPSLHGHAAPDQTIVSRTLRPDPSPPRLRAL